MGMVRSEYTPILSTPRLKTKTEAKENKGLNLLFLLVLGFTIFVLSVSWHLSPGSWIFKSIIVANFLVYYSWELIYFDSLKPGIEPSSPLSPPHIRIKSGHTFHFNYALATLIGVCLSLFIGCFI